MSLANINMVRERFNIPDEKVPHISLTRGYTGASSPLMALDYAIQEGKVKRGDYVMFWTIGGGFQSIAALIKY